MYKFLNRLFVFIVLSFFISCSPSGEANKPNEGDAIDTTTIAVDLMEQRNKDVFIDSISQYLANNSTDAAAFAARAQRHLQLKNLSDAINDAELALAIDSTNTFVQLVFGEVNYITNNTRASKVAWEKCIELDPDNLECRMKLAELYNVVEDYRKSLRLVNEVIDRDKTNPVAYFIKGLNIVYLFNDTAQAVPYIQRALELDEMYFDALDMLGVWLTQRKDPLAAAYLKRAAEISNSASSYYKLGFLYKELGEYEKAIETLDMAVQLNPKDVESYFLIGYCFTELNELEAARESFNKCLAIREVNHRAYFARGYVNELLGDITQAKADYITAINYNPNHEPAKNAIRRLQGN